MSALGKVLSFLGLSRIAAGVGLVLLMAVAALWAGFRHEVHARKAAEARAAQAKAQVVVEKAQTTLSDTAAKAADHAASQALTITVKAQEAASHVQAQPGADQPLPPAVRDSLLAALGELRRESIGASAVPVDPGAAKPAGALPTP